MDSCETNRDHVVRDLRYLKSYGKVSNNQTIYEIAESAIELLKEQGKKEIKLHKRHVITLERNAFTMGDLYEAICETLMDEGELVILSNEGHEKVNFAFYVTHEDT